jgi:hypothetical protein
LDELDEVNAQIHDETSGRNSQEMGDITENRICTESTI